MLSVISLSLIHKHFLLLLFCFPARLWLRNAMFSKPKLCVTYSHTHAAASAHAHIDSRSQRVTLMACTSGNQTRSAIRRRLKLPATRLLRRVINMYKGEANEETTLSERKTHKQSRRAFAARIPSFSELYVKARVGRLTARLKLRSLSWRVFWSHFETKGKRQKDWLLKELCTLHWSLNVINTFTNNFKLYHYMMSLGKLEKCVN